jgi:anthranilate phosphoribosyltransferase
VSGSPVPPLQRAIRRLATGDSLTADESREAFETVMSGEASPAQMSALLVGLRV